MHMDAPVPHDIVCHPRELYGIHREAGIRAFCSCVQQMIRAVACLATVLPLGGKSHKCFLRWLPMP